MRRSRATLMGGLAAMVVFVVLAGCSSSKPSSSSSSSASSSASSSSSSPSSSRSASSSSPSSSSSTSSGTATTDTTPTSQSTTPAPNGAGSPELAARGLYDRWAAGDRAGARSFATDGAVAEIFARPGAGAAWTFQACDGVSGGAYCNFSYVGGAAQMHVADMSNVGGGTITGFKVDSIIFTAD